MTIAFDKQHNENEEYCPVCEDWVTMIWHKAHTSAAALEPDNWEMVCSRCGEPL